MAEIVLGVLPLIGTAFTSYRFLHSQLRAFRHYAKDLDRTAKKFSVQKDRFKLECWLLLRSALDDSTIRQLKGDQSHWDDPEVNAEFERNFKSSYESCLSIIEDVSARLKDFEKELEEFLPLIKDREEDESLGQSVRRLRKRVHVTVNRRKYEDICKELKESNNDLKDLSDSIQRLQQPCSRGHQKCLMDGRRNRGDWGSACKARRASAALYEGLQGTFSCGNSPHGHHSMRLFLDVPKRSSLSTMSLAMRMALSVVGRSSHNPAVPTAFHLRVDSRDMNWAIEDPPSPPDSHSQYENPGRSSKRVKMIEPAQPSAVNASVANTQLQVGGAAFTSEPKETCEQAARDLACILDLCSHFGQHCLCPAQQMPQYIGYLDVQENVRHDFYRSYGRVQTDENVPLSKLLSSFDPRDMNMPQRLKLAKTVATTALTYFDTPWMKDMWRLSDISLLSASTTQDPSVILNTLHLEVDLVSRNRLLTAEDASAMDMALTPQSATNLSDDELLDKGIFNKSLHSLGVALVSIETAQDLDPGNWEDVRNVRKYARGSIFGEKYKAVVEKCFALNCDLRKPNSHRQAFECIVGSLEDMVSSLALDDGEWIS